MKCQSQVLFGVTGEVADIYRNVTMACSSLMPGFFIDLFDGQ